MVKFADDICLWVSGRNWDHRQNQLQSAVQVTEHFLKEREMDIASARLGALAFTREKCSNFLSQVQEHALPRVTSYRFLGVSLDRSLSWPLHTASL